MWSVCIYSVESSQDEEETGVSKPLTARVCIIITPHHVYGIFCVHVHSPALFT